MPLGTPVFHKANANANQSIAPLDATTKSSSLSLFTIPQDETKPRSNSDAYSVSSEQRPSSNDSERVGLSLSVRGYSERRTQLVLPQDYSG